MGRGQLPEKAGCGIDSLCTGSQKREKAVHFFSESRLGSPHEFQSKIVK